MKKEEVRKILQNKKLYVVGLDFGTNPNWDKGIWRKFAIYYINNDMELERIWFDEDEGEGFPVYWKPIRKTRSGRWKGGYFECPVLGTDRAYEILVSIADWAGYKGDIRYEFLSFKI